MTSTKYIILILATKYLAWQTDLLISLG